MPERKGTCDAHPIICDRLHELDAKVDKHNERLAAGERLFVEIKAAIEKLDLVWQKRFVWVVVATSVAVLVGSALSPTATSMLGRVCATIGRLVP